MSRLLAYGIEIFSLQNLEVFFLIPNFRVKQVTYSTLLWFERSLGCALPSTVAMRPEVHQPAFIVLHVCNIFTSVKIHVRLLDVLSSGPSTDLTQTGQTWGVLHVYSKPQTLNP